MAPHINFFGNVQNNATTFSILHNKTPGIHLLPERTKNSHRGQGEKLREYAEEGSLILVLL